MVFHSTSQLSALTQSTDIHLSFDPTPALFAEDPVFVADESIPVLVLPWTIPHPYDPSYFVPRQSTTPDHSLPAQTFYGPVQSGLALVCAISEIAWGAHPPDECDEREEVLDALPPDQLVFLMVLVEICRLEPNFTGFMEPAIADF
ncbi:hypothetical protein B0H10DRAFT_2226515 [Mycena sp. CBHHK59/15]|nr:hypothetical protein B0H10DRAFT_2226515 [Mycena sp. CBHHK59/15]